MKEAARVTDLTAHGVPATPGIGSLDVNIGGLPAWRALEDACICPAQPGGHGPEIALLGSTTVMINGRMAVRVGDFMQGNGPPNAFTVGCGTVIIGDLGFGMGIGANRMSFAQAMRELLKQWPGLTPDQRLAALQMALSATQPKSMPPLKIVPHDFADQRRLGELEFSRWEISLNKSLLAGTMDSARMAQLSNTMYHEGRHGEQWFNAAQSQAAQGADGETIKNNMKIPRNVANAAVSNPAPAGTSEGEMGSAVHTSVYGTRAQQRNTTLSNLNDQDNYQKYRALPEEEDAWRQGDTAQADFQALP